MAADPYIREIGRLEDDRGRIVIVGVDYGTVTLRTLHTRTGGAVALSGHQAESFGQLYISACWAAAAYLGNVQAQAAAEGPAW
jgi:hypothetical protein